MYENSLMGRATDPGFWQEVRTKEVYRGWREEVFALWEKHCRGGVIETLPYSLFRLFSVDGDRSQYERKYFDRRLGMDAAALMALMFPEEEKYLTKLNDLIFAVCDDYTWCVPAHYGDVMRTDRERIDLFAAETGFALAEIATMLGERLDPLVRRRLLEEVEKRIVTPFLSCENYGWWEVGKNNWCAVCTGSVACTMMLLFPERVRPILPRLETAIESYLSGFQDDGICVEGSGYWHYGFGFFVVYADMMRKFTNGEVDYFKREKVKRIATFIQKVFLSENCAVSFADSGTTLRYHLGLVHYLKREYPEDVIVFPPAYSYNYDGCARFCLQLRGALWLDPTLYESPVAFGACQYYAADSQWFIKRTDAYGFAAKGGHNDEFHNHNDVGSFIYAKQGKQILCDLGSGVYDRKYFSKERYSVAECSSRSHSVPIIGGKLQCAGRKYTSADTHVENGEFHTDLAGAYGIDELTSLRRIFRFDETSVTMSDHFVYSGEEELCERLVSLVPPVQKGEGEILLEDTRLLYDPSLCAPVSVTSALAGRGKAYYCIDFVLKKNVRDFFVTVC